MITGSLASGGLVTFSFAQGCSMYFFLMWEHGWETSVCIFNFWSQLAFICQVRLCFLFLTHVLTPVIIIIFLYQFFVYFVSLLITILIGNTYCMYMLVRDGMSIVKAWKNKSTFHLDWSIQHLWFAVLGGSSPAGQRVTCAKFLMRLNIADLIFTA